MIGYRTLIRVVLILSSLVILMVIMTGPAAAESDFYLGIEFHPFTMHSTNGTCEPGDVHDERNCDPINLIFPGRTWADVQGLLEAHGWNSCGLFASTQQLHFSGDPVNQDRQLCKADENPANDPLRYHIRLWQAPNSEVTFGAVHHEIGTIIHTIDMSWEEAEGNTAVDLCGASCGQTGPLPAQIGIQGTGGQWRDWDNNGSATVIPDPNTPTPTPVTPTPTPVTPTPTPVTPTPTPVTPTATPVTPTPTPTDTPVADTMHVGDLDGGSVKSGKNWTAQVTITIHDENEAPVSGATVSGGWSGDTSEAGQCITSASGICSIDSPLMSRKDTESVIFTMSGASHADLTYSAADNHDPDGDSSGTAIQVNSDGSTANPGSPTPTPTPEPTSTPGGPTPTPTNTPDPGPTMHVGDLDGSSASAPRNRWNATVTITVHDSGENPVANATVEGSWSGGANGGDSCETDGNGQCSVTKTDIKSNASSVTFAVDNVTHASVSYNGDANHDPDGDSSGTTIVVLQP